MINKLLSYYTKIIQPYFEKHLQPNVYYHNFEHVYTVAKRALFLYQNEISTQKESDIHAIIIASLFHDIGYDPNKNDFDNIETAIILFDNFKKENQDEMFSNFNITPLIHKLIRATEFPHSKIQDENKHHTKLQLIIQDADLTQAWETNRQLFFTNLEKESKYIVDPLFPPNHMLNTQTAKTTHEIYKKNPETFRYS